MVVLTVCLVCFEVGFVRLVLIPVLLLGYCAWVAGGVYCSCCFLGNLRLVSGWLCGLIVLLIWLIWLLLAIDDCMYCLICLLGWGCLFLWWFVDGWCFGLVFVACCLMAEVFCCVLAFGML